MVDLRRIAYHGARVLTEQRRRTILRLLSDQTTVRLSEICARFGVSAATARRDAEAIARSALARRTRGGLLAPDTSLSEPIYSRKAVAAAGTKTRLGQLAATLLPEDGSIFIDAGSTSLEVARAVLDRPKLRIYTNSVTLLAIASEGRATVYSLGGEVRTVSLALVGAFALNWLERLRFDAAVVGASGIDAEQGASTTELAEATVKIEALKRARLRVLVAHSEKWDKPAALQFAPWSAFHHFVTDKSPPKPGRALLASAGVHLHLLTHK